VFDHSELRDSVILAKDKGLVRESYDYATWSGTSYGYSYNWFAQLRSFDIVNGLNDEKSAPQEWKLYQNYPNPFNPTTTISYQIPKNGFVSLVVYNALGREVKTLVNEAKTQGIHSVEFNASNLPSGVYIYTLKAGEYVASRKLMLVK
jgi:hypothetical protein